MDAMRSIGLPAKYSNLDLAPPDKCEFFSPLPQSAFHDVPGIQVQVDRSGKLRNRKFHVGQCRSCRKTQAIYLPVLSILAISRSTSRESWSPECIMAAI